MYVSIAKSPSKNKRISKKEFLALSIRQQKQYLELFPKSSYRFLLPRAGSNLEKKEKPKKEDKVKPFDSAPNKKTRQANSGGADDGVEAKPKRIRRKSFDALDDKDKEEYLKKYPKSVHKKAFDALMAKENPKLLRGTLPGTSLVTIPVHGGAQHSEKEARALRVQEHAQVEAQIQRLNKDGAAVINKHSIKAVAKIEPRDLKVASKAIDENRHQIIDVVGERIQENPKLFGRGLKALGKLFNGAKKLRPKELRASKRVLVQVAMVALLGTGVMALSMGAAPIAVVASRMLYDVWLEHHRGGNPDEPKDSDIIPRLKRKSLEDDSDSEEKETYSISERGDKKAQQYWKAQGYEWHSRSNRWEKPKASDNVKALPSPKGSKKKWSEEDAEDAEFAAASSQDDEPYEMDPDHQFVINTILDQLSDLFKYQDVDRIKNLNDKIFAAASAEDSSFDLYRTLFDAVSKLSYQRLSGIPGKYLYGVFRVPLPVILEIVERVMQVPPEEEIDDVYSVHHFSGPTMLVTVGEDFSGIVHFMFTEV